MKIGVDYYPEQWDRSLWEQDASLMAQTGVKLVRLAEFAWSKLEPKDGTFDFGWLDEAIGIFQKFGIEVVMSIPTNCPPLWLYEAHPEVIRVGADGNRIQTGIRGHRCINSPVFQAYAKRLTSKLILHYGNHPSVTAWQIDNELEAYPCCCDECKARFRNWLLDKYDTLEAINQAFGTSVWSGEYSDVTQIQPPAAYPKAWQNPALCLDWYRFNCDSVAAYVKELAMIMRREVPKVRITTNTWFSENTPDFYKLFNEVDFVSYDNYPPVRLPEDPEELYSHAFYLDLMRGIKGRSFWIMEQLSGPTGSWAPMSPTPKPGMIMGYSLQALAHGADTVVHFRWRTAITGAEMHWHGLIDHSNVPGRRFFEFSELCKTATKLNVIDSTELVSDVAIIYSPENDYAFKAQPQVEGFSYLEQLRYFHAAFSRYGANIDVVPPEADLSHYKVVIAPTMYIHKSAAAENLYRYVINGGTLVMTNRSGVKDNNNNCIMETLPTVYKELIGAEITEYDPIGSTEQTIVDFAGNKFTCRQWCDILRVTTAKAYAEYNDNFYRCCPAVTMNRYCAGVAYYVGTVCKMDFYESFVGNLMRQTGMPRLKGLPKGVEVTTRTNGLDDFIFFFNNSEENATITLPKAMFSIIDSAGKDKIELKPFEMDIVRK
jgi:beta-galactosidase